MEEQFRATCEKLAATRNTLSKARDACAALAKELDEKNNTIAHLPQLQDFEKQAFELANKVLAERKKLKSLQASLDKTVGVGGM